MFTPPPSPLPLPRIVVTDESDSESSSEKDDLSREPLLSVPSSSSRNREEKRRMRESQTATAEAIIQTYERKRRTARRTRWAVLLVPVVLILVAFTSRRVTMLGVLDDFESVLGFGLDVNGMRVGDELHSQLGSGALIPSESGWREGETTGHQSEERDQTCHHNHHKRQVLSLSNPAGPSSSDLITSDPPESTGAPEPSDASETSSSPPTTTIPQTEQTVPPVPDASNPPTLPTPFPQPFDTTGAISNLTTQTCVNFFTNMTQQLAFRSCRPFGLLESLSFEFIEAQTNLTVLNTLIYGTCNTDTPLDTCISNMNWFASALQDTCSSELSQSNQLVKQTLLGLESYSLLRTAACLENQQSNTYCYAAAAHASSPADLYLYQLPLGVGFPVATTQPSCSTCSKSLLGLYADAVRSGDDDGSVEGLRETYEEPANQAESVCGTGFAAVGVVTSGAGRGGWRGGGMMEGGVEMGLGLGMVVGVVLFMLEAWP